MSEALVSFYEELKNNERTTIDSKELSFCSKNGNKGIDMTQLTKLLLFWVVGGLVSLMPDLVNIFVNPNISVALKEFMSKENIFVVSTTLTISVLLEMFFDKKSSNTKYILLGIEVVLIVFSVHISALLHFNIGVNYIDKIGITTFILCAVISMAGYVIVSVRERR